MERNELSHQLRWNYLSINKFQSCSNHVNGLQLYDLSHAGSFWPSKTAPKPSQMIFFDFFLTWSYSKITSNVLVSNPYFSSNATFLLSVLISTAWTLAYSCFLVDQHPSHTTYALNCCPMRVPLSNTSCHITLFWLVTPFFGKLFCFIYIFLES